jgi:hypothetical protein
MLRRIVPGVLMAAAAFAGLARASEGQPPPHPVVVMGASVNEARCYVVGSSIAIDVGGLPPGQSVLAGAENTVDVNKRADKHGRARLTLFAPNSTPHGRPVVPLLISVDSWNNETQTDQHVPLAVLLGTRKGCLALSHVER